MEKAGKTYTTLKKVRFALFIRSYAHNYISHYLKTKYKIDDRLPSNKLRNAYFNKRTLPEISRLAKVLNFDYVLLWRSMVLNKNQPLNKTIGNREEIKLYLSIESELISLAIAKRKQSDYTDPDYEEEFGILITAIERAIGNALEDIEDDLSFARQSEELNRKYRYLYYKVAYKYKLPTLRITPFILRLIS
jgi:hypothetical protein